MSIMSRIKYALSTPRGEDLPESEQKHQRRKDLAHDTGIQPSSDLATENSAEEHPGNQEKACLIVDITGFGVGQEGKQPRRWNQRDQAGSLRAVLAEPKEQAEQRNQQDAAADTH